MDNIPSYATPTRAALNRQKSSSAVIPDDAKSVKSTKSTGSNTTSPVHSVGRRGSSNTLQSSISLATVARRPSIGQQNSQPPLMHSNSAPSLQISPSLPLPEEDPSIASKYDPAHFSVLVVGPGCSYEKDQLKQRNLKVFGIEPPNAAIMLLRKHGNAIHLILVSTEIENMSLEEFLEELKDSGLDHIPIIVLYRDEVDMLDSLMERGVSECITHDMPAGLFRSKVDGVLQLNWYKNRYQTERQRRNSLEREFSKLFALSGLSREQLASDLQQVGKAWETPTQVIEQTSQELSSKNEVNINDYKEALIKVVKTEETPPELQNKLLNDSKFSTLDRKTQDWVFREYTRTRGLSSGSFTTSKENFWKLFGTKDEPNNPKELDSEVVQFARRAFAKYDVDSDGTISLNELAEAMKDHGMSEEQALKIMNKFDVDGNGSISFKEFLKGFPKEIFQPKEPKKVEPVEKDSVQEKPAPPAPVESPKKEIQEKPPQQQEIPEPKSPEKAVTPLYPEPAFSPVVVTSTPEPVSTGKPLVRAELYDVDLYKKTVLQHKESLKTWEFDLWQCTDDELLFLLIFMFEDRSCLEVFQMPREKLVNFIVAVRSHYRTNPYHNWRHAWDVTHTCFLFISQSGAASYLTHVEIVSLFIAAICHDLEHPGLNNTFQVNLQTPLALLYNDTSVLENHHCSCAFSIIRDPENNIFTNVMPAEFKQIRKIVIESILQTDMAYHFELVAKFTSRTKKPEPYSKDKKEDRQLLVNILLHSADLSNSVKPWKMARYWSDLVQTEFLSQGDKEKELGLPISMYMDRENYNQAKMSLNFFNFIVEPLFASIKELLPKVEICLGNLFYNKKMWTMIEEENQKQSQLDGSAAINAPVPPPVVEKKDETVIEQIDEEPLPSPAKKEDEEPSLEFRKYQAKQSSKIAERINKTVVKAWTDNLVPLRPGTASPNLSPTNTTVVSPIFPTKGLPASKNKKPPIAGGYYQSRRPASPSTTIGTTTLRSLSSKTNPRSAVLLNPLHEPSPRLYRNRTNTLESL